MVFNLIEEVLLQEISMEIRLLFLRLLVVIKSSECAVGLITFVLVRIEFVGFFFER